MSGNNIKSADLLEDVFTKMPNLTILKLEGNPCIKEISHYRKNYVARLPKVLGRPLVGSDLGSVGRSGSWPWSALAVVQGEERSRP